MRSDVPHATRARRETLGRVWVWNPFGETTDSWDPLHRCEDWEHALEAGDEERRRIARDLHDGLQARLVLLAIKAHAIRADPSLGQAQRFESSDLETGLQTAITELRELVHGVMPAALTERGLYAAAEELTDRIPIPTELRFSHDGVELTRRVESTCYFVISEALANAVKHSRARELLLALEHADGVLRIEVRDDGVGGVRPGDGVGLRGMTDRVEGLTDV